MASLSALQSCAATTMQRMGVSRTPCTSFLLSSFRLPRQQFTGVRRIRCQAEDGTQEQPKSVTPPSPASPPPPTPTPTPPRAPKVSTKFSDVLAFSGPAPERINGRLAMVGFVSAMAVELASGNDLVSQLSSGGLPWFVLASGLLSAASLVPLFQGVTAESKSGGLMTSDAEMWNGRFAMLGLVALAFTEYLKGGPLV